MIMPNIEKTQQGRHHSNPLYRIAPYVQNILDDLSHSNRVRLLHQRFKPAVDLSIKHWPRAVFGLLSTRMLIAYYPCFSALGEAFRAFQDLMREHNELGLKLWFLSGGVALFFMPLIILPFFEVLSNTVLALRWDKPIRHAEFMLKYSRKMFYFLGILGVLSIALLMRFAGNETDLGREVWEMKGGALESGVTLWALRAWVKDLKDEPRTWWGGDKEIQADPEKDDGEQKDLEELKDVLTS